MKQNVWTIVVILSILSGCSGARTPAIPAGPNAHRQTVTAADFKRVVAWGSKGQLAIASCPQNYKVIAGGTSSNDGSFVGTGYANSKYTAWIVKPQAGASAEAFATCVEKGPIGLYFKWHDSTPVSDIADAQCPADENIVTGFGTGTVTNSWFDPSTNSYWVIGGGIAYAMCANSGVGIVVRHAWNKSQKPKTVYAGCGKGYEVVGGAMGDNQWPGPPIQQHPGIASGPGKNGYDGWWTFSNANNELTWAACVPM